MRLGKKELEQVVTALINRKGDPPPGVSRETYVLVRKRTMYAGFVSSEAVIPGGPGPAARELLKEVDTQLATRDDYLLMVKEYGFATIEAFKAVT